MEHGFEMTDASIKVIITGSSGMVGKGVLLECLDSPIISEVLIVNRTALNITNPKLLSQVKIIMLNIIKNKFEINSNKLNN